MRNKNIEFAQLIYDFDGDIEKAKIITQYRENLTDKGFEVYCKYFFQFIQGYKTKRNELGVYNRGDGCIDIKGRKVKNGEKIFLIVQCKRHTNDLRIKDIREFWGEIEPKAKLYPNTNIYFITTGRVTDKQVKFAEGRGFYLKDYRNIIEMNRLYSFNQFKKHINDSLYLPETIFRPIQTQLTSEYDNCIYSKDMMTFLRTIRKKVSEKKQLSLFDICTNQTLEILAKQRPHNLEKLKNTVEGSLLDIREREKLIKHGEEFFKGIELIKKYSLLTPSSSLSGSQ